MSRAPRTTQRRTLADPVSTESHTRPTNPPNPKPNLNPNPDPAPILKPPSLTFLGLSKSLNSSQTHKLRTPPKPNSLKAMLSVSAMVESSKEEEEEKEKKPGDKAVSLKGFEEELKMMKKKKKKESRLAVPSSVPSSVSLGGRRRFGGTHNELSDVFASNGVKVVSVDMPPVMQIHAVELARKVHDSLEKFTSKTLASTLKKEFDGIYGPAWHCIVGTSFGSFVTHSVGGFLYFSMDQKLYILLFKTTVQRAD